VYDTIQSLGLVHLTLKRYGVEEKASQIERQSISIRSFSPVIKRIELEILINAPVL
jgi:hypothetical protein